MPLLSLRFLVITPLLASLLLPGSSWALTDSEYRQLGLRYRSQERYPEAIAAFQKSVELNPQNLSGRVLLGWTLHLSGQRDAAVAALGQVVQTDLANIPALNALGIVYLVRGDLFPAALTHTWAALLQPNNEIAYYNLSLAYHRLKLYPWAIAHGQEAARLESSNPHPLVALAIAHWDKGDRQAAQQAYRQALALDGRYGDRSFLAFLAEAGFSQDQIQVTEQVLASLNAT